MLTCFTQQLLYQEEKCPFLVLPGLQSPSCLLTPFLVPFFTYFGTAEKNLQALYGVNLFFPLPKIYPGSVSTATAYTVCGRGCVCTVCMNTGVFRGTRTKCKPSAAIQQVESCQGSFWQPTGGSCQLQQEDTSHCSWWKSDYSDYSLCYRLAMCRMLQCVPTPSVLPQKIVSQG